MTIDPAVLATLHGTARALIYSATLVVVGAAVFEALVLGCATAGCDEAAALIAPTMRLESIGGAALVAAYVLRFYVQTVDTYLTFVPTPYMVRMLLFSTRGWGWGVLAQGILSVLALALLVQRPSAPWRRLATMSAALLAALAVPLTGHAIAHGGVFAVAVQVTHVLAAGSWLGTLAVLWCVTRGPRISMDALSQIVQRFSPVALGAAMALAVTGTGALYVHVEGLRDLVRTAYGAALLAKVGAFSAAAAMGYVNWKRVTPNLRSAGGFRLFSTTVLIEVACAAGAVLLTSVLTGLARPGDAGP